MAEKKYYWLKLKRDFFKRHDIRIIEEMPNGKDYILFYLKMLLESIDHEGELRFSETIPYNEQMLSVITNTNIDIVKAAMGVFMELNMIEIFDDCTIYMNEVQKLIGSETANAKRVREHRQRQEEKKALPSAAKTNAERQRAYRAKQACEEKQHIPFIEDYTNKKRYGGNYYIVMKRDGFKCKICGSIETLCVHHIDGYDESKPENNAENKMIVTCRQCHSNIHAGTPIPKDVLDSIDYYFSNESNDLSNGDVIICNTEIEKEKNIELENREKRQIEIIDLFNSLCPSLNPVKYLSEETKKEIEAQLLKYSIDDFKLLFEKAESSDFLKGENKQKWTASFEWLIKDQNMAKVLNGNFDNAKSKKTDFTGYNHQELEALTRAETVNIKGNPELEKEAAELREKLQEAYS